MAAAVSLPRSLRRRGRCPWRTLRWGGCQTLRRHTADHADLRCKAWLSGGRRPARRQPDCHRSRPPASSRPQGLPGASVRLPVAAVSRSLAVREFPAGRWKRIAFTLEGGYVGARGHHAVSSPGLRGPRCCMSLTSGASQKQRLLWRFPGETPSAMCFSGGFCRIPRIPSPADPPALALAPAPLRLTMG